MVDQLKAGSLTNGEPSIENIRSFVNQRVAARQAFVDGFEVLQPPPGGEEFHDAALRIMTRIAAAEAALAEVAGGGAFASFDALWQTAEGQQVLDAERDVIARAKQRRPSSTTPQMLSSPVRFGYLPR